MFNQRFSRSHGRARRPKTTGELTTSIIEFIFSSRTEGHLILDSVLTSFPGLSSFIRPRSARSRPRLNLDKPLFFSALHHLAPILIALPTLRNSGYERRAARLLHPAPGICINKRQTPTIAGTARHAQEKCPALNYFRHLQAQLGF